MIIILWYKSGETVNLKIIYLLKVYYELYYYYIIFLNYILMNHIEINQ